MTPDIQQAKKFLDMLGHGDTMFTFQTFDDDKNRKDPYIPRILHGSLDQHVKSLTRLQQRGAGVFVMVNRGDGLIHDGKKSCRNEENVVHVRALFADLDGSPLQPLLDCSQPDIIVESSPGKWHAYFLTSDCPLENFKLRQQQIAKKFNSDPRVHDLPRVMRLPGFFHQKDKPFMTRVIYPE